MSKAPLGLLVHFMMAFGIGTVWARQKVAPPPKLLKSQSEMGTSIRHKRDFPCGSRPDRF